MCAGRGGLRRGGRGGRGSGGNTGCRNSRKWLLGPPPPGGTGKAGRQPWEPKVTARLALSSGSRRCGGGGDGGPVPWGGRGRVDGGVRGRRPHCCSPPSSGVPQEPEASPPVPGVTLPDLHSGVPRLENRRGPSGAPPPPPHPAPGVVGEGSGSSGPAGGGGGVGPGVGSRVQSRSVPSASFRFPRKELRPQTQRDRGPTPPAPTCTARFSLSLRLLVSELRPRWHLPLCRPRAGSPARPVAEPAFLSLTCRFQGSE